MFGKLKSFMGAGAQAVVKEMNAEQTGNLDFLQAAAAGCALVAAHDGNADSAERNKAISVITKNKTLGSVYQANQIEAIVNGSIDKATDSSGKQELVNELKDLKNHPNGGAMAQSVYLMSKDVAQADGSIGEREQQALTILANILGINEGDFAFG